MPPSPSIQLPGARAHGRLALAVLVSGAAHLLWLGLVQTTSVALPRFPGHDDAPPQAATEPQPDPAPAAPTDVRPPGRMDVLAAATRDAAVIARELGGLNGILHNAALLGDTTPISHYDAQLWHRVIQVNVNGPYMLTRACLELLQQAADPRVVFTAHQVEQAYWGAYGVSKSAVLSLMRILAEELSTHKPVRVNAIEPGEVQSPLAARVFPGKNLKSLPAIESIMPSYLYLMGRDSANINGQIISAQE